MSMPSLTKQRMQTNIHHISSSQPTDSMRLARPLKKPHVDYILLYVVLALTAVGLVSVLSSSAHMAQSQMGDSSHFLKRQLVGVGLGFGALLVAMKSDIYRLTRWLKPMLLLTVLLLMATHFPVIGVTAKGSSRWVNLGGFVLQPSEVAKPLLVFFLATVLGHPEAQRLSLRQKIDILIPTLGIPLLVMVEPDLGTTIVISATIFILYFTSGMPYWKAASMILGGGLLFFIVSWNTPYQKARLLSFMDPWADPQGKGFHLIQSLIAIGSGGPVGNGYGQSVQKLFYLPEQHTDFIFAVFSEEFGLIGGLILLTLFVLLAQRGLSIACKVPTPFLKLLATGLTSMVSLQAFVNLGVVTGTIPTTGITLPFISFGSSSLIVNLAAMGLLLNVSRYVETSPTEGNTT